MLSSLATSDTQTPLAWATQSLEADKKHRLGVVSPHVVSIDDFLDFSQAADDLLMTAEMKTDSFDPQLSSLQPHNTLIGYHRNVATNHAHHLAEIVKDSISLNAHHPDPRSLADSISRCVLNVDATGRPNSLLPERSIIPPNRAQRLTILQRRRLSYMQRLRTASTSKHFKRQEPLDIAPASVSGLRRQSVVPDSISPPLGPSPDTSLTPLPRKRHSRRASVCCLRSAALPTSTDSPETWSDAVIENSHDLVFVLSLKGIVLYMSPSVHRVLGFHPAQIIGRPLSDFSHPADVGPFSRQLKEAIVLPDGKDHPSESKYTTGVKVHRRVDLIVRMTCSNGAFSLIETTGRVSVERAKHRKVVVCSGRPHPIPMLPWSGVHKDLLHFQMSAWLKVSHNGIFLGATGQVEQILGIKDIHLLGSHVCDLPMIGSSSGLLDALRSCRSVSFQNDYKEPDTARMAPLKLTVYPWTCSGRPGSVSYVLVQQQPQLQQPTEDTTPPKSPMPIAPEVPAKRKASEREPIELQQGTASLCDSALQANGASLPLVTADDAASSVFSEITGFHTGSWLIELRRLHNENRRLHHELRTMRQRSQAKSVK